MARTSKKSRRKKQRRKERPVVSLEERRQAQSIVDALDGLDGVAQITGCKSKTSIHNWIANGRFPSRFYKVMATALQARGRTAPLALWDQRGNHRLVKAHLDDAIAA